MQKLQDEMMVYLLPKYQKNSHKKKLFMIDFAIRGIVSFEKDFKKRLDSIIFLELLKKGKEIYYGDRVDFILPENSLAVTAIPFLPEGLLRNKIKLIIPHIKDANLKKLQVITLDAEFNFQEDGVECEVMTFWSFALGGDL
jgi:predicted AAA+ superfamily ATPase